MKKTVSLFLVLPLLLTLAAPSLAAEEAAFSDVSQTQWYAGYVNRAAQLGFVHGLGGGIFDPEGDVTYAHFATMMCNTSYLSEVSAIAVLPNAPWWTAYCMVANAHGLFYNTPMSNQQKWADYAETPIPRGDMAVMTYNYLTHCGKGTLASASLDIVRADITDISGLNVFHAKAVAYCFANKILNGVGDGRFLPDSSLTRAQAAKVICEAYDFTTARQS
ncbi:S-layer homology domain-containing protein [Colidextribacter sp. OB.20]|uniref:S-layer homology domain-containing protein n=1 Tax=Colidextribacter sp. OB.20 TaxID=2304568 RepID=UPI00136A0653|nr:S-layer homology domain-containing protein [Colidextribacter sp. OB.20]NBI09562.1 S-layer homology domain-containing protein [Colidextribacter sp. OB.20]